VNVNVIVILNGHEAFDSAHGVDQEVVLLSPLLLGQNPLLFLGGENESDVDAMKVGDVGQKCGFVGKMRTATIGAAERSASWEVKRRRFGRR